MHEVMKHGAIIRREPERAQRTGSIVFVVLVVRFDEPHLPFVVWYQSPQVNAQEPTYWSGEYCATLTEACQEFERRTGKAA